MPHDPHHSSGLRPRRALLAGGLGLAGLGLLPRVWAQPAPAARVPGHPAGHTPGRFVLVFLRGACDGLSAFVPYADAHYARLRPSIAVPPPDGSADAALRLDATFALHPALAELLPLWQSGAFAFVPAAGLHDDTRSHFDAQYQWETGLPGQRKAAPGWLNRLAGLAGTPTAAPAPAASPSTRTAPPTRALGVGEAAPRILAGDAPVKLVASGGAAQRAGALEQPRTREALLALYGGSDALSRTFQQGAASRLATAQELQAEMRAADNGAASPTRLVQDARHLGALMRRDPALRLGFLSAGGWDTHAGQGGASGALANHLRELAAALTQLRRDLAEPGDVIAVVSEFGRTAAENGSRGTDHGHGNALWLIGERVAGGRWHGAWSGLAAGDLHEGRDLPVHHDFRAVLAQVLRPTLGLRDSQLADLFPGAPWDTRLDGLMRSA